MDYKQKLNELLLITASRIKFITTVAFIILSGSFFIFHNINAQEIPNLPGAIEGEGIFFKITDSEYLNISTNSSESIKIRMESIPEMVTITIEPSASSTALLTQITLTGFNPLTTYYKYEDDYHNLTKFTTDENGSYSYTQDISQLHFIFIQPRKSTKFIKDDATGGDCYLIGNWDATTKTCTLTTDLNETIQIDNDNIVLDGNGHAIIGSNTGNGVYLYQKTGVVVKNLDIKQFGYGIHLYSSNKNILLSNTILNNGINILINWHSNENIIQNNIIKTNTGYYNNWYGVYITMASNSNDVFNNTIINNRYYGISIYANSTNNRIYNNNFLNNNSGGHQAYDVSWGNNVFNLSLPIGGNYWYPFIGNCNDRNSDGFCDVPYPVVSYKYNDDYLPWIKQDGWKNQPPTITNLNQYKSDGTTLISENSITTESTVVFKAILNDPDNDQVKLQIELKEFSQPFDGTNLLGSDFVSSGITASTTRYGLIDGQYKWRARAVDDKGNASQWQEFGTVGNADFEVKLVPLYTQVLSPYPSIADTDEWDGLQYADGKSDCGFSIAKCGCAITSAVMIARYYNVLETQNKDVNPKEINNWLKNEPGGYVKGDVNWITVAKYTNWRIKYEKTDKTTNNYALLDEFLNKTQPVIAKANAGRGGINRQHFFVIDNKLASAYGVKDPAWYNTKILDESASDELNKIRDYENGFDGLRIYKKGDGLAQSAITFALGSPAELLITDSLGRKLGKDKNSIEYTEIPQGLYFEDGFDDPTGEIPPSGERNKLIQILSPLAGEYKLEVIGTGVGDYSLTSTFFDTQGQVNHQEFHSETASDAVAQYNVSFDQNNSNNTAIELFDETPPEAEISFNPNTHKLEIKGKDNTTVHPTVSFIETDDDSIYQIQDEAENMTKLFFEKIKQEGKEIKAELKAIQYNDAPIIELPETELKYEWSIDKETNQIKELEQKIEVEDQFEIKAKYHHKKGETTVKIELRDQEETKQTLPSLIIIKLITKSGNLDFEF